jgi:DNA-binding response OmpR family regulator
MSKVLLVEDDPTMLSLLGTLLEMEGFQAIKLEKFNAIVMAIQNEAPDVVLMDVNLQDANGLDVLAELRQDDSLKGVKVIMSSGMDYRRESLERGADEFIQKPYMPDDLIDMVKQLSAVNKAS